MGVQQGEVVRIDVVGDIDNVDLIVQSYQGQLDSAVTLTPAEAVADWSAFFGTLWELIKAAHNTLVVFRRLRAQNLTTLELLGEQTFGTPRVGTAVGDALANQITMPVSFPTVVPRVMLRKLWGPASEGNIDADGTFGSAILEDAIDGAAYMLESLDLGNGIWTYGYLSPKTLAFERPISAFVTEVPGTLRRRRKGQGA